MHGVTMKSIGYNCNEQARAYDIDIMRMISHIGDQD
jgi:hypothetical protein